MIEEVGGRVDQFQHLLNSIELIEISRESIKRGHGDKQTHISIWSAAQPSKNKE